MSLLDELRAAMRDTPREIPEALVVPPGFDLATLPPELGPGLNGIRVIVSPYVPPGQVYLLTKPHDEPPRDPLDPSWRRVIRPESLVKIGLVKIDGVT